MRLIILPHFSPAPGPVAIEIMHAGITALSPVNGRPASKIGNWR
jgi:hypothetical protein